MNYQKDSIDYDETRYESHGGKAQWRESSNQVEIIVPAISPTFVRFFMTIWLVGWFVGFVFATGMVYKGIDHGFAFVFMLVWLAGWLTGGFFVGRLAWWMWFGKEYLLFKSGELKIERHGYWFSKPKVYDLSKAVRYRAQEESGPFGGSNRIGRTYKLDDSGTMRFDYGMKTVKFGIGLEEAEARFLLDKLAKRGMIDPAKILP